MLKLSGQRRRERRVPQLQQKPKPKPKPKPQLHPHPHPPQQRQQQKQKQLRNQNQNKKEQGLMQKQGWLGLQVKPLVQVRRRKKHQGKRERLPLYLREKSFSRGLTTRERDKRRNNMRARNTQHVLLLQKESPPQRRQLHSNHHHSNELGQWLWWRRRVKNIFKQWTRRRQRTKNLKKRRKHRKKKAGHWVKTNKNFPTNKKEPKGFVCSSGQNEYSRLNWTNKNNQKQPRKSFVLLQHLFS